MASVCIGDFDTSERDEVGNTMGKTMKKVRFSAVYLRESTGGVSHMGGVIIYNRGIY